MKPLSFVQKSFYSACVFFGTLVMLSIGYGTFTSMNTATSGETLTASGWNTMVNNITDLDARCGKPQYIKLGMSWYQPSPANGTVITFDTVRSSQGITSSSNGINLKAGVTYRIEAAVSILSPTSYMYLGYQLYNGTTLFGEQAYSEWTNSTYGFKPQILEFYTPATDQTIQLKVTDNSMGAGQISPYYNTYLVATVMK